MSTNFYDLQFDKKDFSADKFERGEYEECRFLHCNFSGADLSQVYFSDCEFVGCNFSMTKLGGTTFSGIQFRDCKLMGLHFEECNRIVFVVAFENCILNFSSFFQLKVRKTVFKNCTLEQTDFTESDLTQSSFLHCNLDRAVFDNSIVEKVDFSTAYNFTINPERNKIKKARFSRDGLSGLLSAYDIVIE